MVSDRDLLRQYIDHGSQAAFTTLVQRHLNVVYRTALRRVGGNSHAADDVTQRVFMALTRKAEQVRDHASLAGWLYTSTRFAAAELVRTEQRRRKYEQEAHTMNQWTAPDSLTPEQLEPLLDDVLEQLPERDREAVLLHFFERRSFVEIAAMCSSTADATRMRVNRALDRLRRELQRRGIASTGAALSAALGSQATLAATLPNASAVAARILAAKGAAPAVGGSAAARILSALRTTPVAVSAGLAVIVGGVVVVRHAVASGPTVAVATPPAPAVSGIGAVVTERIPSGSADGMHSPVTNSVNPPAVARFDQLTTKEKSILALLWRMHLRAAPNTRSVLGIGRNAPNIDGVDSLCDEGFVEETPASQPSFRRVALTRAGLEFCEAERESVERFQPTARLRPGSAE